MKRAFSSSVRVGFTASVFLLVPATTGRAAQVRPLRVPDRPLVRLEVTVLQFDDTNTPIPMPPEARLAKDGTVAFDVKPSRGGYLALVAAGQKGPPWLWPSIATGQPVTAKATVRVPEGKIRLRGPGPTRLSLVFSPSPLDGSAQRWLQQIILREPKLEPNDRPGGRALLFEGPLGEKDGGRHPGKAEAEGKSAQRTNLFAEMRGEPNCGGAGGGLGAVAAARRRVVAQN